MGVHKLCHSLAHQWGKGIGRKALVPWVTHLFNTLEIERVGMTTTQEKWDKGKEKVKFYVDAYARGETKPRFNFKDFNWELISNL